MDLPNPERVQKEGAGEMPYTDIFMDLPDVKQEFLRYVESTLTPSGAKIETFTVMAEPGPPRGDGVGITHTGSLKSHVLTHSGEKPFTCSFCKSSFKHEKILNRHMLTHGEKKPFSCSVCKSSFGQKPYLRKHMLTHSAAKPFLCSICNYSFRSKEYLNRHMLIHGLPVCGPPVKFASSFPVDSD